MSQIHFVLREATEKDIYAIVSIFNEVVLNTTATFEENPRTIEEGLSAFFERASSGYPTLVAECEGSVVGYGTLGTFRKASGYKSTVENAIHVAKEYRGKGIGTQILKELITQGKVRGYSSIISAIDTSNERSILLHEQMGFKQVGNIPRAAKKFSKWLDLILLQLILNE